MEYTQNSSITWIIKHRITEAKRDVGLNKATSFKTDSTSPSQLMDRHAFPKSSHLNSKLESKLKTTKNNLKDQICKH